MQTSKIKIEKPKVVSTPTAQSILPAACYPWLARGVFSFAQTSSGLGAFRPAFAQPRVSGTATVTPCQSCSGTEVTVCHVKDDAVVLTPVLFAVSGFAGSSGATRPARRSRP